MTMALVDSTAIADSYLDKQAMESYKHNEKLWASLAPYTKNKLKKPEPPKFD